MVLVVPPEKRAQVTEKIREAASMLLKDDGEGLCPEGAKLVVRAKVDQDGNVTGEVELTCEF
jgi:hypothetical protein